MKKTSLMVFLILFGAGLCAVAQRRMEYRMFNMAGALESALSLNPQPLARHELGSLASPGTVTLFAVVAADRSSKRLVKGLEVRLEGDDTWNNNRHCKNSAYIDADALLEFERRLVGLLVDSEKLQQHSATPSVAFAGNKSSAEPQQDIFYVPFEVGSYWTGDRYGVYINAPLSRVATGWSPGCQFNMPNAHVSELLTLVYKGHSWLEKYLPKAQPSEGAVKGQ